LTGGHLLEMTHKTNSVDEGRQRITETLNNGTALEKFKQMLIRQRVSEEVAQQLCYGDSAVVLPMAAHTIEIKSPVAGS